MCADKFKKKNQNEDDLSEKEIDEALDESFPASDPPSWTPGETKKNVDIPTEEKNKDDQSKNKNKDNCGC